MYFNELNKKAQQRILDESFNLDVDGVSLGSKGAKEHFDYWNTSDYHFDANGERAICESCGKEAVEISVDFTHCKECKEAQAVDDASWRA